MNTKGDENILVCSFGIDKLGEKKPQIGNFFCLKTTHVAVIL